MGRLTIDIPDGTHHNLRVMAANQGVTIKDYVLERITPDLNFSKSNEPSLAQLAADWEERSKGFKLGRGNRSLREVINEGHKW
jgi:plasmid stability protein